MVNVKENRSERRRSGMSGRMMRGVGGRGERSGIRRGRRGVGKGGGKELEEEKR